MAGNQRGDSDRVVAAGLNDHYVLLRIEFPVSQKHARDKIRRRAETG